MDPVGGGVALITKVAVPTALVVSPDFVAIAFIVSDALTLNDPPPYGVEDVDGVQGAMQ